MKTKHLRCLLSLALLPVLLQEGKAQTETETTVDTVIVSDTIRWTWRATTGEVKSLSISVTTAGIYQVWWGDGEMTEMRIPSLVESLWSESHQYRIGGSYEVIIFGVKTGSPSNYVEKAFGSRFAMVYVEGGEFEMGATAEQSVAAKDNEYPVRTVKLDSYYIGKYEVTQAQWKAVMGTTVGYQMKKNYPKENYSPNDWNQLKTGDDYPIVYVTWEEAQEFCRRMSEATGKKYVLPTEAQWEYAARGGNKSNHYMYSGSDNVYEVGWYYYKGVAEHIQEVGLKKANELGIYDMSGNVHEWCSDWYGSYDKNDTINPQGAANPDDESLGGWCRVVRGGAWNMYPYDCRVSCRRKGSEVVYPGNGYGGYVLGFRIAVLL